jgi:hypothetical protein
METDRRRDVLFVKSFAFFMDYQSREEEVGSTEKALFGAMKSYMDGVPWFNSVTDADIGLWAGTFVSYPAAVGDALAEVDGLRDGSLLKDKEKMAQHLQSRVAQGAL